VPQDFLDAVAAGHATAPIDHASEFDQIAQAHTAIERPHQRTIVCAQIRAPSHASVRREQGGRDGLLGACGTYV
jgi:hypothetical protein